MICSLGKMDLNNFKLVLHISLMTSFFYIDRIKKMTLKSKAKLIVFSGLPASGKTTLASKLAAHLKAAYIRMDAITVGLKDETKKPDLPAQCYRVARALASENLRLGNSVVSDSVNPDNRTRNEWNNLAKSIGVQFMHIEIVCSNKEEHQLRLNTRNTTLVGLTDPTWQEIQDREYHPWDQERVLIETSGKTPESVFAEILSALNKHGRF